MYRNIDAISSAGSVASVTSHRPVGSNAGLLTLRSGIRLAWQARGNPDGEAWLVIHGGPGTGGNAGLWQALDPASQRAFMPDQRGSGRSRPRGAAAAQTAATLVSELEALRRHLGVERWSLLAGSWGTVLALLYAATYTDRVDRLVLRGAFALTRRELDNVLVPSCRPGKTLRPGGDIRDAGPVPQARSTVQALSRIGRLLQSATPAVASLRALRGWGLREQVLALQGMRRSLRHARTTGAAHARAVAHEVTGLQRRWRRAQAQSDRPQRLRSDRAAWQKFRVQAAVLHGRAGVRPGDLDRALIRLARHGVPVHWVHGAFDAVCPPANSRRWAALGARRGGPVQLDITPAGHLGHEPATLAALRKAVRSSAPRAGSGRA
ncbi:alpha/beta fold hydrolase [uncultured Hydrogenophaga sp.]|uniref:alpha/beta fold hydrolase n=1 Tax=uncultured Hydrogenophaga sp. TaxID=199683 RepID=UPI003748FACB